MKRNYILIFILAFVLRLILMPISAHSDLLSINMYPDLLVKEHIVDILSYSKEKVDRQNFSFYPPLTYYTIGIFQIPYSLVSDTFSQWMTQLRSESGKDFMGQTANELINSPNSMLYKDLFLAKLPYLFFDIASLFILYKFAKGKIISKSILLLWLFNPVLIYGTYIFGQFDTIPSFFVILGFYLLRKNPTLAILAIGIAAAYKNYALFFIPPISFIYGYNMKEKVKLILVGISPTLFFILPTLFSNPNQAIFAVFNKILIKSDTMLVGWALYSQYVRYGLLLLFYALVTVLALVLKIKDKWRFAISLCLISGLLLLTLAPRTSLHYLFWLTPLILLWFKNVKSAAIVTVVQFVSFASFKILANQLQLGLFAPINPIYFSQLPTFNGLIDQIIPYKIFSTFGFTIYHLFNFVLIFTVLKELFFQTEIDIKTNKK